MGDTQELISDGDWDARMPLHFSTALLPDGWAHDVRVTVGPDGLIADIATGVAAEAGDATHAIGLPGMPNLHSHAFQRGMAGLTETSGEGEDSFWTWRQAMYGFLDKLTPDDVEVIATQLYMEMLEAGFTSVAEFHYLHHAADGAGYDDPAEMASRIVAAAQVSGIGLTLLPVFYANGGFGDQPVKDQQRRFASTPDGFARLLEQSATHLKALPHAQLGVAPHSLRAVTPATLTAVTTLTDGPIHIHVAEQLQEVDECLAWSGQRPVEWLLANQPVDARWCLIHATHMNPRETRFFTETGAIAGLCPQTEANLGDGIFDAVRFLAGAGRFGVGTDSHIRVDVAEELRTLEYGQRLRDKARNVLSRTGETRGSTGRLLYDGALIGGAQALDRDTGRLAVGAIADIVALDAGHPLLTSRAGDQLLDSWLFAGDHTLVSDVWVSGKLVVTGGRHVGREASRARFAKVMAKLTG